MSRKTPSDMQICVIQRHDGSQEYAVWTTHYSLYGAGGHFQTGDGGQAGIPCDVDKWWGTHWTAREDATPVDGQAA